MKQLTKIHWTERWEEVKNPFDIYQKYDYPYQHCCRLIIITTRAIISSCGKTILDSCGGSISIVLLATRLS